MYIEWIMSQGREGGREERRKGGRDERRKQEGRKEDVHLEEM